MQRVPPSTFSRVGSQTTMSASLPIAMLPFLPNRPNSFAGAVDVISTNLLSEILPSTTPSHSRCRRARDSLAHDAFEGYRAATASRRSSHWAKCGQTARMRSMPIAETARGPCNVFWYPVNALRSRFEGAV